jgi:membrane-associated protease RseP (regulator of RpoE activity)
MALDDFPLLPPPDPVQQKADALRLELGGLFEVENVSSKSRGRVILFRGRLRGDPDRNYERIRGRFGQHGYTPMVRRRGRKDEVLAVEGLIERAGTGNPLTNVLLLAATIITLLEAGSAMSGHSLFESALRLSPAAVYQAVLAGAPYAIALLGILGVHEIGHYLAAQVHGVRATLPYFIPMPFGGFGTLGAFIALRSPMKNRKVLFDIGLSGPYAGFIVAIFLLVVGLLLSTAYVPIGFQSIWTTERLGSSILFGALAGALTDVPAGQTLLLHPVARAAWLGLLLTGVNLLPVGQLDGGHAAYALLGRWAHGLAMLVLGGLIVAGSFLSPTWFIWAFFIMLGGMRHPPPLNDLSGVGPLRQAVGLMTLGLFVLVAIPVPFR